MTGVKKLNFKLNENGLTLIEVLASIVILSIVLISFSSILLQSVKHTKYNEEKLTAVDIAEEVVGMMRGTKSTKVDVTKYLETPFDIVTTCEEGPVGLSKATITVEAKENKTQKQSPFVTEIYIQQGGGCPDE